jgi:hypothetical protein
MLEFLMEFITLFVFILGIIVGEALAYKAFGKPKSSAVFFIDLVIIVLLIAFVYSYISFYGEGLVFHITNFVIGAITIVIARAAEWMLKLTTKGRMAKPGVVRMIRTLAQKGLDDNEIKKALKDMGVSPKMMDKYEKMIERSVPAFIPKMVKLEHAVEGIEKRLQLIEEKLPKTDK